MAENIFPDGVSFVPPHKNAPTYIKGTLQFNIGKFIEFADQHSVGGGLKIDIKESKNGVIYLALNVYQKKETPKAEEPQEIPGVTFDKINEGGEDAGENNDEIPF